MDTVEFSFVLEKKKKIQISVGGHAPANQTITANWGDCGQQVNSLNMRDSYYCLPKEMFLLKSVMYDAMTNGVCNIKILKLFGFHLSN